MSNCMDYEEFVEYIRDNLQEIFEALNLGQVSIERVVRNNGVMYDTLGFEKHGRDTTPVIYIQDFYEHYCRGMDPDKIISCISDIIRNQSDECRKIGPGWIRNFENVRDHIVMRVINYKRNRPQLMFCPHIRKLDLALTFHIFIDNTDSIGMCQVTNEMLENWKVDVRTLYELACVNMKRLSKPVVQPLDDLLSAYKLDIRSFFRMIGRNGLLYDAEEMPQLYILTNERRMDGAIMMFNNEVMRDFAGKQNSDIYILPSSIHEVLLVAATPDLDSEYMQIIVSDANDQVVSDDAVLSGHVYRYLKDEERIVIEA